MTPEPDSARRTLFYDGQCPFCSRYGEFVRGTAPEGLQVRDARNAAAQVRQLRADGWDPDAGMILQDEDGVHQGEEAVRRLSGLLSPRSRRGRWLTWVLSRRPLMLALYPLLQLLRHVALRARGRNPHIDA